MWTAGIQMKWVCDHRSKSQFKQLRKSPKKKKDFGWPKRFQKVSKFKVAIYENGVWQQDLEGRYYD